MTVFYVIGGLLALWAVVLAAIGITRDRFPGGRGGERVVIGISVTLAVCAIGSAIISGALEEEEESEAAESEAAESEAAESEAAAETAPAPTETGGAAPTATGAEEPAGGEELALSADPSGDFSFDVTELEAAPGPTTLVMENPAPVPHNVSLEGEGVSEEGQTVETDGTSTVAAELEAGEYVFYCSVPGHREGGMEGTLTIE